MNDNDFEKIITRMKPDAKSEPSFEADLRRRLLVELAANPPRQKQTIYTFMSNNMKFAVATLAVVIVVGLTALSLTHKNSGNGPVAFNTPTVTKLGGNAFGSLNSLSANSGSSSGGNSATAPTDAVAPSFGSAPTAAVAPQATAGAGSSGAVGTSKIAANAMPIFVGQTVKYDYKGDAINQDKSTLDVVKVTPTAISADQATNAVNGLSFGVGDLSSFGGSSVTDVTLAQNVKFGYIISVDFPTGAISIYENWNEWPQNNGTPLTASDVPATSTIVGIANQFLSDHGIPTSAYGTPQVMNNSAYAIPADAESGNGGGAVSASAGSASVGSAPAMSMPIYFSDSVQVTYPLVVNGLPVYDAGGQPSGLSVTVDLRNQKVSNVYGLNAVQYQSSAYDAITDANKIISLAETVENGPMIYNEGVAVPPSPTGTGTGSTVTVDLGTPTLVYETMWQSANDGTSQQFLVPAYLFPETSGQNAGTANVIVPLISAFAQDSNGGGVVVPMTK